MNETQSMIDTDDRDGQTCTKCGVDYYTETGIYDDGDGLLHCNNKKCNHEVKRYKSEDEPKPESMKQTALSPEAQAVLDAANQAYDQAATVAQGTAAALRAAANQVVPANGSRKNNEIRAELLAIADELESL